MHLPEGRVCSEGTETEIHDDFIEEYEAGIEAEAELDAEEAE